MASTVRTVCVYCGAAWGARGEYAEAARAFGRELARRNAILVYGGGKIGLMGEIADASMAAGGQTIGVITEELKLKEVGHERITELRVVETMHQRKKMMADLADAFVALPGGLGTFDELFEILTWAQLGIHEKPVGLLNTAGYYDPMLAFLDHAQREGFLRIDARKAMIVAGEPGALLDGLAGWGGFTRVPWTTERPGGR